MVHVHEKGKFTERFASTHQTMRWIIRAIGFALMALPLQALALHLQQTSSGQSVTRNGVAATDGIAKLTIAPSLPYSLADSGTITATATADGAAISSSTVTNTPVFTVASDPGDAPNAELCLNFHYAASGSGAVTVGTGSIAGGAGGTTGFVVNAAAGPASVTAPNPVSLTRTPLVGSPVLVVEAGPSTFATTGASQQFQMTASGSVLVSAGDTLALDSVLALGARGEIPDGSAFGTYHTSFRLNACPGPAVPVPTLSNRGNWALASLLLVIALVLLARRRASNTHPIS